MGLWVRLTNTILSGEVNAILSMLYDWEEPSPRQFRKLGVEVFMKCGVRSSLIPQIVNYLQERTMQVKWHGKTSSIRELNGGGPHGASFVICEYLPQLNSNTD